MNSQRFDYSGFSRIRIERALSVDVLKSDSYSVTIGDDFSRIRMEVIGDTLCIERRGIDWFHGRPHVVVTAPVLREIIMGGACQGKVIGFQSGDFAVKLNGASHLELGQMNTGNLIVEISGASNLAGDINYSGEAKFNVSGASRMLLQGTGNAGKLDISGASQARFFNLALNTVELKLSGASQAQLKVSARIDCDLSGASRMEYTGSPIIGSMKVNGASTINHR